jgi:hypothetical protein
MTIYRFIACATVALACNPSWYLGGTAINLLKSNKFFSPNVLPSLENTKEEDLVNATRLIQKSYEWISCCDPDFKNNHISISQNLPIPPLGDSNIPVITVKVEGNPFTAHYFHSGEGHECAIIDANGQLITLIAFTDDQYLIEEAAAIQTSLQIVLRSHCWPLNEPTLPETVPRPVFERELPSSRLETTLNDAFLASSLKMKFINRIKYDFKSIGHISPAISCNMRIIFSKLAQKSLEVFKSPSLDQNPFVIVEESMRCPLKMDDDSLVAIVQDKKEEEYFMIFFYENKMLRSALVDRFGRPWVGGILSNEENRPIHTPNIIRLCRDILTMPICFVKVIKRLNNVYSNNLGEKVALALTYAGTGLTYRYMNVRIEEESIIVENDDFTVLLENNDDAWNLLHKKNKKLLYA